MLADSRLSTPAPALVRPPEPLNGEAKVTLLLPVSMMAACPKATGAIAAETSTVLPAAHCNPPPVKVMLGGLVVNGKFDEEENSVRRR